MAPNPIGGHHGGNYLQSVPSSFLSSEVVRWSPTQRAQSNRHWSSYLCRYKCSNMASIEDYYREKHNITDQDIENFHQREIDLKNMMAWGASARGGQLTYKDEKIAEMLKKKEEEEKRKEEEKNEREKKWVEILDHSGGDLHAIEIIRDRCSSVNFVPARTVVEYSLETRQIDPVCFNDVAGMAFTCCTEAALHWKGKGGQMRVSFFYVVPDESPIEHALVGKEFDDSFGSFLLDSKPQELIAYTAQKPKTPQETEQILAMRKKVEDQVAKSSQSKITYEQNKAGKVVKSPSSKSRRFPFGK
ncbi:hypothetical protein F5Y13DRAFT_170934 [Hypoxylon sp. FL1857]|nr:hypothetical protein F5Y13DRAFT_170934 [Hypoxylon sp. FL1857]